MDDVYREMLSVALGQRREDFERIRALEARVAALVDELRRYTTAQVVSAL